ncbi:hypothetical protein ONS95_002161 [Cadophora gregata]|uniref:uncharacterized protein n=1 Tax=Cadophora gregata TaxID=51156 RepID=UPI0026DD8672|nr:uncharacterized protein ONS95_002161 [Cadophora gregata]KAK0109469.1 hypothetical protein ONS95_002161 [Cadophora gregata]
MMMGEIYAGASRVVVWLEESSPPMVRTMEFLAQICPGDRITRYQADFHLGRLQHVSKEGTVSTVDTAEISYPFLHEYWNRLWIIQEVLLGSEVLVCSGKQSVPIGALQEFFQITMKIPERFLKGFDPTRNLLLSEIAKSSLALLLSRRNDSINSPSDIAELPLLYLVSDHADAKCLDKRDRIFGLSSLAISCCVEAVPVDYSRSYSEICDMVLAHHCTSHINESDGAIRDFRHFHHALRINSEKYEKLQEPKSRLYDAKTWTKDLVEDCSLEIRANIQSRIIWLSPILTDPIPIENFIFPQVPEFNQMVVKSLHQTIYSNLDGKVPIATQFDLVRPLHTHDYYQIISRGHILTSLSSVTSMTWGAIMDHANTYSDSTDALHYKDRLVAALAVYGVELSTTRWSTVFTSRGVKKPRRERNSRSGSSLKSTVVPIGSDELTDIAFQVLSAIREAIPISRRPLLRIAIDEMGAMYLMPCHAELQDLICQFPHADITLLARQSSALELCSIEGQGQELLLTHDKNFVKSTDSSFLQPKIGLFYSHRRITHEVKIRLPLWLLKTISVESATTDVPEWCPSRSIQLYQISAVWGIHLCDYLPGNCSCMTITRIVSGADPITQVQRPLNSHKKAFCNKGVTKILQPALNHLWLAPVISI